MLVDDVEIFPQMIEKVGLLLDEKYEFKEYDPSLDDKCLSDILRTLSKTDLVQIEFDGDQADEDEFKRNCKAELIRQFLDQLKLIQA